MKRDRKNGSGKLKTLSGPIFPSLHPLSVINSSEKGPFLRKGGRGIGRKSAIELENPEY
jgi:hypothetical protein